MDLGLAAPAPLAFNLSSSNSSDSGGSAAGLLVLDNCTVVAASCSNLKQFAAWVGEKQLAATSDMNVSLMVRFLKLGFGSWIGVWSVDPVDHKLGLLLYCFHSLLHATHCHNSHS